MTMVRTNVSMLVSERLSRRVMALLVAAVMAIGCEPALDQGGTSTDAAASADDDVLDGGTPASDSGASPPDSAVSDQDAGDGDDGSRDPLDAGSGDPGSTPEDAGSAPQDAGVLQDGGSDTPSDCNEVTDQRVIAVAKSGAADFATVQQAIDSVPRANTMPTVIRIAPGTYTEKLRVDRPAITLCGQKGQEKSTILAYGDGADTPKPDGGTLGTSGSASVNLSASDVSVENLTISNTRGAGIQAVALLVTGERVQFKNARFLGHQDTLYVKSGSQYFKDCYVEGTVDYIFGAATAVFDTCTVHSVGGGSAVVAPNTDRATPFGIVFLGGNLTAATSVKASSQNLGRNWGAYGMTTFLGTDLGAHITDVGWIKMGENTLATARFAECQTTGAGAKTASRAPESKQLTNEEALDFTVENVLRPWQPRFAETAVVGAELAGPCSAASGQLTPS